MDESVLRQKLERFFEYAGADVDRAEELYHEDAVLEFPQSGERFEGRDKFTEWRSQYPVERADMQYRIRRVTVRGDFTVVEMSASYDRGATWVHGVQLLDWRGDKVAEEQGHTAIWAGAKLAAGDAGSGTICHQGDVWFGNRDADAVGMSAGQDCADRRHDCRRPTGPAPRSAL
jgi:hypothetical protein